MPRYKVIGIMSGTSLDGLDLCYCSFELKDNKWSYSIDRAVTIAYTEEWLRKLRSSHTLVAEELLLLHMEYGRWIGRQVKEVFGSVDVDFISSHGHTIFHQPERKFTFQLGHGQSIAMESGLKTICDFRTADVLLGGKGAPLVPIGDKLLFGEYKSCINLGGFANISLANGGNIKAFDICPLNIVLNYLSKRLAFEYDHGGEIAKSGVVLKNLLSQLNQLAYYTETFPKSLGREWVEEHILPLLNDKADVKNLLRTYTEHAAIQISNTLREIDNDSKVLFTGGGSKNIFLMERISSYSNNNITIPNNDLIDYKEALIFAFLGVLRLEGKPNVLSSVTGAAQDICSGIIFNP